MSSTDTIHQSFELSIKQIQNWEYSTSCNNHKFFFSKSSSLLAYKNLSEGFKHIIEGFKHIIERFKYKKKQQSFTFRFQSAACSFLHQERHRVGEIEKERFFTGFFRHGSDTISNIKRRFFWLLFRRRSFY